MMTLFAWTAAYTIVICLGIIVLLAGSYLATTFARGRLRLVLQAILGLAGLVLALLLF